MSGDRVTRGKTRPGRLARLDAWLIATEPDLLARTDGPWADAVAVDVGLGARPDTTVEAHRAWRSVAPDLLTLGVDTDEDRVHAALASTHEPGLTFRTGGFDLPLAPGQTARLVRAANVLRQYREAQVDAAHQILGHALLPGGLLLDATTSREGDVATALLLRRTGGGLDREGLLLSTACLRGFAPMQLRDHLPRQLRHARPGSAIRAFLDAWTEAWQAVRAEGVTEPAEALRASAARLPDVDVTRAHLGDVVWRPVGGVR